MWGLSKQVLSAPPEHRAGRNLPPVLDHHIANDSCARGHECSRFRVHPKGHVHGSSAG